MYIYSINVPMPFFKHSVFFIAKLLRINTFTAYNISEYLELKYSLKHSFVQRNIVSAVVHCSQFTDEIHTIFHRYYKVFSRFPSGIHLHTQIGLAGMQYFWANSVNAFSVEISKCPVTRKQHIFVYMMWRHLLAMFDPIMHQMNESVCTFDTVRR